MRVKILVVPALLHQAILHGAEMCAWVDEHGEATTATVVSLLQAGAGPDDALAAALARTG